MRPLPHVRLHLRQLVHRLQDRLPSYPACFIIGHVKIDRTRRRVPPCLLRAVLVEQELSAAVVV